MAWPVTRQFTAPEFPQPTTNPAPAFPDGGLTRITTAPPGSPVTNTAQDTASLIHDFGGFPDFPGPVTAAPHADDGRPRNADAPTPYADRPLDSGGGDFNAYLAAFAQRQSRPRPFIEEP